MKGAYLNAKMKDIAIMKIAGPEIDMFYDLDPGKEYCTRNWIKRFMDVFNQPYHGMSCSRTH